MSTARLTAVLTQEQFEAEHEKLDVAMFSAPDEATREKAKKEHDDFIKSHPEEAQVSQQKAAQAGPDLFQFLQLLSLLKQAPRGVSNDNDNNNDFELRSPGLGF